MLAQNMQNWMSDAHITRLKYANVLFFIHIFVLMKKLLFAITTFSMLFFTAGVGEAKAQKMNYEIKILKFYLNGDTIDLDEPIVFTGTLKKHSRRMEVVKVGDRTLHLEFWLTQEGVMGQKFNVFQHKYYYKNTDESWRLLCVTPRLKFIGRHYDRGHYKYYDPLNGEELEVYYVLSVDKA
ncbi:MAG: hypothetical protein ACI83I_000772 [Bacteroidia bacterium]